MWIRTILCWYLMHVSLGISYRTAEIYWYFTEIEIFILPKLIFITYLCPMYDMYVRLPIPNFLHHCLSKNVETFVNKHDSNCSIIPGQPSSMWCYHPSRGSDLVQKEANNAGGIHKLKTEHIIHQSRLRCQSANLLTVPLIHTEWSLFVRFCVYFFSLV